MADPFEGSITFFSLEGAALDARIVLHQYPWNIDPHNGPYLANKSCEPGHGYSEVSTHVKRLPEDWSDADTMTVIGDISHSLVVGTDVIIARTSDFKQVQEIAAKLGYRPAYAGEFLQLLWWLDTSSEYDCNGWFFCYAGRKDRYAILAQFNHFKNPSLLHITFDTHIGNQIEEGYVSANADTYCFFVRAK